MRFIPLACILASATNALAFRTVVIDPGHGGRDRGGMPGQYLAEKNLTLDVAQRLRSDLRMAGLRTVMTRSGDRYVPLQKRVDIANAQRNAIFISIHFNAAQRRGASGFETYYYKRSALPLAASVQKRLLRSCPGEENRGIKEKRYFVLRKTRIPAVLAECGFLTNGKEGARCSNPAYRQRLADAIAAAIEASR